MLFGAMSSYAESKSGFCFDNGKNDASFVHRLHGAETVLTIDSYDGEEVGHLKKGKKTYLVSAHPMSFLNKAYMLGHSLADSVERKGVDITNLHGEPSHSGQVWMVTQRKSDVDYLKTAKTPFEAICSSGSELLENTNLNIYDHPKEKGFYKSVSNTTTGRNFLKHLYHVVEDLNVMKCGTPMTWTKADTLAENIEAPTWVEGEKVLAKCR